MSHDYHKGREGTIIYDGCAECDERVKDPIKALLNLDTDNYQALRERMQRVEFAGTETYRSVNEARVGKHLYAIAVLEERHGAVR